MIAKRAYGFVHRGSGGRDVDFRGSAVEGAADAHLAPRRRLLIAVEYVIRARFATI
jgi:cold shock CspA family protein